GARGCLGSPADASTQAGTPRFTRGRFGSPADASAHPRTLRLTRGRFGSRADASVHAAVRGLPEAASHPVGADAVPAGPVPALAPVHSGPGAPWAPGGVAPSPSTRSRPAVRPPVSESTRALSPPSTGEAKARERGPEERGESDGSRTRRTRRPRHRELAGDRPSHGGGVRPRGRARRRHLSQRPG